MAGVPPGVLQSRNPNLTSTKFVLGGIVLTQFEVPESFEDGVDVQLAVHKLMDETGNPVTRVHAMGAFPCPTTWDGELYGNTAMTRHRLFKKLAAAQQPISWTFGSFSSTVVIKSYKGQVKHEHLVNYAIELVVVEDTSGVTSSATSSVTNFNSQLQTTYGGANNATIAWLTAIPPSPSDLLGPIDIKDQHDSLTSFLNGIQNFASQDVPTVLSAVSRINAFTSTLGKYVAPYLSKQLSAFDAQAVNNILRAINGYNLLATNLGQITGQGAAKTITASYGPGVSLFAVAAHYYPDLDVATTAQTIATANGLKTMFLSDRMTLSIPAVFQ